MRPRYPVTSKENDVGLKELQEQLIYILGYDANIYDSSVDVSGVYDTIDSTVESSGVTMMNDRLYSSETAVYTTVYGAGYRHLILRRAHG